MQIQREGMKGALALLKPPLVPTYLPEEARGCDGSESYPPGEVRHHSAEDYGQGEDGIHGHVVLICGVKATILFVKCTKKTPT